MLKFSILPHISDEILSRFCSDDLIQILIKIGLVLNAKNKAIFRRNYMESLGHNCGNISPTICTNKKYADFQQGYIFSFDLLDHFNKSNKLTNFDFCDVTLGHSIQTIPNKVGVAEALKQIDKHKQKRNEVRRGVKNF